MDSTFSFAAPVLRQEGGFRYHYLPVPTSTGEMLWNAGVRRVIATLNGVEVRRALQRSDEQPFVLVVGLSVLRDCGARLGDLVAVDLRPDPNPDAIELGEEFTAALDEDPEAAARFFSFTPGMQRSLASYVTGAKRPETRLRRAYDLAEKIRSHRLHSDLNPPHSA